MKNIKNPPSKLKRLTALFAEFVQNAGERLPVSLNSLLSREASPLSREAIPVYVRQEGGCEGGARSRRHRDRY